MENEPTLKTGRNEAIMLFLLTVQYQHMLGEEEWKLALPRLKLQFDKFEQWLRSKGIFLNDD